MANTVIPLTTPSASGSLAGELGTQIPITAPLTGSGSLAVELGVVEAGVPIDAALSGTGSLANNLAVAAGIDATPTGAGQLAGAIAINVAAAASVTGTGAIASEIAVAVEAAPTLSGTGSLLAETAIAVEAGPALSGSGAITAEIAGGVPIAADLAAGYNGLSAEVGIVAAAGEEPAPAPAPTPAVGSTSYASAVDILDYLRPKRGEIILAGRAEGRIPDCICSAANPQIIRPLSSTIRHEPPRLLLVRYQIITNVYTQIRLARPIGYAKHNLVICDVHNELRIADFKGWNVTVLRPIREQEQDTVRNETEEALLMLLRR